MVVDNCASCKKQTCIKTGKLCAKINRILRREKIYSADYIRPMRSSKDRQDGLGKWREVGFSSLWKQDMERLGIQ